MELGIRGRNAVITGGSRGLGRAMALALAAEGVNVAICARSQPALDETLQDLQNHGIEAMAQRCDIADEAALERFLDRVHQHLGCVDILICNASAMGASDDRQGWRRSIDLDLLSTVQAVQQVSPWMQQAGGGSIILMSSIAALRGAGAPAYVTAKAALISYAKAMAVKLAPDGIRVNSIAPGSIEFPGGVWERARQEQPERYHSTLNRIPAGRFGRPEEVASVAVFLASEQARWVTGTCIPVDGGQLLSVGK